MSILKPCPFCGGEAETLTAESMHGGYLFGIMCNDCRSRGDVYGTEAEAIEAWNTRHEWTCENVADWKDDKGVLHRDARLFKCSLCGFKADDFYGDDEQNFPNYCPNCGSKVVD